MLSQQDITIVKSTIPVLNAAGTAVTEHFYARMFKHNPELEHTFNMTNQKTGKQKTALFDAIVAYANHLDNVAVLEHAVNRISNKHASLHIQPGDYDIVGHHLIETFRELLGADFTPEIESAWTNAYIQLANLFVDKEATLYESTAQQEGGWKGKRPFVVSRKQDESSLVTSFELSPKDGLPIIGYKAGQYIAVEVEPKDNEYREIRQYSLSDAMRTSHYRISVKRESVPFCGVVSTHLHDNVRVGDTVMLYAPRGDFFLSEDDKPVVLISAGVGVTPMMAMLETLHLNNNTCAVTFIHACENRYQHSFVERVSAICNEHQWPNFTWYQHKESNDSERVKAGLVDLSAIALPFEEANFYVCGPVGFMTFIKSQLHAKGVCDSRIHYEVFGPHEGL